MTLKVLDFFTDNKLSLNKVKALLMREALFYILVEIDGVVQRLEALVSKKFHYESLKQFRDVKTNKVHEYNVLVDFLIHSKATIKRRWNLSEKEYQALISGLEACLIGKYSNRTFVGKVCLFVKGFFKDFVKRLKRGDR